MAADDYEVVVYKVLTYLYACIKAGVNPSVSKLNVAHVCKVDSTPIM